MMWSARVSYSTQLLALSLLAVPGCGGSDSPAAPQTSLIVRVQTNGFELDADGYSVQIGGASRPLNTNASVTISGVGTGSQTVTLTGIAPNCAVTGTNPLSVQISSGQTTTAAFEVFCTATPGGSYRIALMTNHDPLTPNGAWEIASMNSDGSIVPLTTNAFFDGFPVWSPDGQKIAFASDRDGPLNVYAMNQDGSNVVRLTSTPSPLQDRFPSWSPDGTKILFESNRTGGSEIYLMNADGTNVVRLTDNATGDNAPRFSPDGSKIVFVSNRDAPSTQAPFGKWEVYVMNADGSSQTRVTNDAAQAEVPSFLNASKILFDTNRSGPFNIHSVNVDGTGETQLASGQTTFLAVGSPDQTRVMFSVVSGGQGEVYTMKPDGTGITPLTRQQSGVTNVGYSYRK